VAVTNERRFTCDDCPPGRTYEAGHVIRIGDKHYCEAHVGAHVKDVPIR
jgi:hypothetical protein